MRLFVLLVLFSVVQAALMLAAIRLRRWVRHREEQRLWLRVEAARIRERRERVRLEPL